MGNLDRHGAIFMDYRNDPLEDKNIVIYGHHMKDGTMFRDLMKYKKRDFYEDNASIYLDMGDKVTEYIIFSYTYPGQAMWIWPFPSIVR